MSLTIFIFFDFHVYLIIIFNSKCLQLVNERVQLLESLCVIEHGYRTIKRTGRSTKRMGVDERYSKMRYNIVPHDATNMAQEHVLLVHQLLKESAVDAASDHSDSNNSGASSSNSNNNNNTSTSVELPIKLEPTVVYRVHCEADDARYEPFDRLPSQQKMWYGIRKCELGGVLSHGIPFPAAEAPTSAFPYGKCLQLSSSPLEAAQRCLNFEPLSDSVADGEVEGEDADGNGQGRTVVLGLCTVACGNMHSVHNATIFVRPPVPCHSVRRNRSVMIYDLGQVRLDSIVFFDAIGGTRKNKDGATASMLADQIMTDVAEESSDKDAPPLSSATNVTDSAVNADVVMEEALLQKSLSSVALQTSLVEDKNQQERQEMNSSSNINNSSSSCEEATKAAPSAPSSTMAMDFANQILMEAEGSLASP